MTKTYKVIHSSVPCSNTKIASQRPCHAAKKLYKKLNATDDITLSFENKNHKTYAYKVSRNKVMKIGGSRDYLNNVTLDPIIKHAIIQKSFNMSFSQFQSQCTRDIKDMIDGFDKTDTKKWIKCTSNCWNVSKKYINTEIRSTAFMLRILSYSLLSIRKDATPFHVNFVGNVNDITGNWKKDRGLFNIDKTLFNNTSRGHLILGFGPSGSGKTFWSRNIIELTHDMDSANPDTYLSIDGGLYREYSTVYQTIMTEIHRNKDLGITGFNNMIPKAVNIGPLAGLFSSGGIKKSIFQFLLLQRTRGIYVNLYIPETLGGCTVYLTKIRECKNTYKAYIDVTNSYNKWIGLIIWQHKCPADCDKPMGYKCKSTTTSGTMREKIEGKKYSSGAWETSMKQGIKQSRKSNIWFDIHNSGSMENKSIIATNQTQLQKHKTELERKYHCAFAF